MFKAIQSILPGNLKKTGLTGKIDENRILAMYKNEIGKYLSPELTGRVRPLGCEDKVIIVASLSEQATRVLKDHEAEIVKRLNAAAGQTAADRVKYLT